MANFANRMPKFYQISYNSQISVTYVKVGSIRNLHLTFYGFYQHINKHQSNTWVENNKYTIG